jgi:hypothetical protein
MMGNEYYNPQFNTNMYGGQQYWQPMMDRLAQMRQQYNPPVPQMNPNVPYSNLVKVLNAAEANGYVVAPGNTVYMVSKDYNEMYIKTVDMNGDPNMRYFRMSEFHPENRMQDTEYVTRAEFLQLVNENNRMLSMIQQLTEGRYEQRNAYESTKPAPNFSADPAIRQTVSGGSENGSHETD